MDALTQEQTPTQTASKRITGFIGKLVDDRGYGFIRTDARKQYFFHYRDLIDPSHKNTIKPGQPVEFTPIDQSEARKTKHTAKDRATTVALIQ